LAFMAVPKPARRYPALNRCYELLSSAEADS
jgi:hypothetical protein